MDMTSKELFIAELKKHFSQEEQDFIMRRCTPMEQYLDEDYNEDKLYSFISHQLSFSRYGFHKFMLLVENLYYTLNFSGWIKSKMKNTMMQNIKNIISPIVKEEFKELNKNQQEKLVQDLSNTTIIHVESKNCINKLIPIFEDLYSLKNLIPQSNNKDVSIQKISFTLQTNRGTKKVEFKSDIFTHIMQYEFYHYIMRNFPDNSFKSKNDITIKISQLKTYHKYMPTLVAYDIAKLFIDKGIINKISEKSDKKHGLKNKEGKDLELSNHICVVIFNIIKALGLERHRNAKDYIPETAPDSEKATYIKGLLKTANNEKNREKYTFNLSSILDGFDKFHLWLYKNNLNTKLFDTNNVDDK